MTAKSEKVEKPEAAPAAEHPPEIPMAPAKAFQLQEITNNGWRVRLPPAVGSDKARDVDYMGKVLAINGAQFRPFDRILCVSDDASWCAEFLIADSAPGYVSLVHMFLITLPARADTGDARLPDGFAVEKDPHDGRWAIKKPDGSRMTNIRGLSRTDAINELLSSAMFQDSVYASKASIV